MSERKCDYLKTIIEKTRLARIKSEKRLLELDSLLKHATVYFACLTVVLSIIPLFLTEANERTNGILSFLAIASSIVITICTLYASGEDYALRAERMKYAYLEMQRLLFELDDSELGPSEKEFERRADEIGQRYVEVLMSTENHTTQDYLGYENSQLLFGHPFSFYITRIGIYLALPALLLFIAVMVCG